MSGWNEVQLVHRSLPEANFDEVDLSTSLAGVPLSAPIIINAMTGGAHGVEAINRDLAAVAARLHIPMALGSQTAGLNDRAVLESYRVVRRENPRGVIIGNLGAGATVDAARQAVEMVGADLLQLHLNAPQELVMPEGDRDFRGQLKAIEAVVRALPIPVMIKECGFGLGRATARQLHEVGVRLVDVSGLGGTNFARIEAMRSGEELDPGLAEWGIPTPSAVAEVAALGLEGLQIVASGGIRFGSEAAKAIALGASAVGVAGPVLHHLNEGGRDGARGYLERMLLDLRRVALLCGATSIAALGLQPVVVTGGVGEWCRLRGVDLKELARRG